MNHAESRKKYYEANKERLLAEMKAYREANREAIRTKQEEWRRKNEGHTYTDTTAGYVRYIGYEHPAANPCGLTMYHRIVLWDKLNGQDAPCYWGCGKVVSWSKQHPYSADAMTVDHLNGIRDDNRPENLVPSCQKCNVTVSRASRRQPKPECTFKGCDREALGLQDLCAQHHKQRWAGKPLEPIKPNMSREQLDEIVESVKAGESITSIGARLGVNFSGVSRAFKRETGVSVREFKAGASV